MRTFSYSQVAALTATGVAALALLGSSTMAQVAPPPGGAVVSRVGKEFWANSIHLNYQYQPTVAALSNGNFVVAWTDSSYTKPDTASDTIRARLFTPGGVPIAKEFMVPDQYRLDQFTPKAAGYTGGFVIIWGDSSGTGSDTSGHAVSGRRFANDGTAAAGQFTVNLVSQWDQDDPAISSIPGGGFAASWDDWSGTNGDGGGNEPAVRGALFGANGKRIGNEFRANTTVQNQQYQSGIAGLPNGGAVVVWTDLSQTIPQDTDQGSVIRGQLIGANGALSGNEFVVNTNLAQSQLYPVVASLNNGTYVVIWKCEYYCTNSNREYEYHGQIWSTAGKKIGGEFIVPATGGYPSEPEIAVAGFPNGRFVVVWADFAADKYDYSQSGIRGQLYMPNGTPLGNTLFVNKVTANTQDEPAVAVLENNDFVVAWTDWSDTRVNQSPNVRGQVFHVNRWRN